MKDLIFYDECVYSVKIFIVNSPAHLDYCLGRGEKYADLREINGYKNSKEEDLTYMNVVILLT